MRGYSSRELERLAGEMSSIQRMKYYELVNKGYSPDKAMQLIGAKGDFVPDYITDKQHKVIQRALISVKAHKRKKTKGVRKHYRRKPSRRKKMKKVSFTTSNGKKVFFTPKKTKTKSKRKSRFKKGSKQAKAFMQKLRELR